MKIARIYIKPNGERWFAMPISDSDNAQTIYAHMKSQGAVAHPMFVVPEAAVHFIDVVETKELPADLATSPPFTGVSH